MNIPISLFLGSADFLWNTTKTKNTKKEEKVQFLNRWNLSSTLETWLISVCLSFSSCSDNLCGRSCFDLLSHNFYQLSNCCSQRNHFQNTFQQWFICKYFLLIRKQSAREKSNTSLICILCNEIQKASILGIAYVLKSQFLEKKTILHLTYDGTWSKASSNSTSYCCVQMSNLHMGKDLTIEIFGFNIQELLKLLKKLLKKLWTFFFPMFFSLSVLDQTLISIWT